MTLDQYIQKVPKVELHVHLEGSMPPATLLALAQKHQITLPANTLEEVKAWYKFTDFPHFAEIYMLISRCLQTPEDIEQLAFDFLANQASQNILYSEVTYTAYTHYRQKGISFKDQLAALNRARQRAEAQFGVTMRYIIDIPREWVTVDEATITARWVAEAYQNLENGIVAIGLGGYEVGYDPSLFADSWAIAREAGVPLVLHAGETEGADHIWSALRQGSVRIGHGVRCLEDPALVDYLRQHQIPLEVCPTSNVCLKVSPSLEEHPLPTLMKEGLYVTLNTDDPPMFGTTLIQELTKCAHLYHWDHDVVDQLILNAGKAVLLPALERFDLMNRLRTEMASLRAQFAF